MIGAIIGDIAGSNYEFIANHDRNVDLFGEGAQYTDDSILTAATADAIIRHMPFDDAYRLWASIFTNPKGQYGNNFMRWVNDPTINTNSMGNGCLMRLAPVCWAFDTLDETIVMAITSTLGSHPHPESKRAAATMAEVIYRMRNGEGREVIREVADRNGYALSTYEELGIGDDFRGTCAAALEAAFSCVMNAESFEDAIRMAISIGADADTIGAITGAIAEACFPIPEDMIKAAKQRTHYLIRETITRLSSYIEEKGIHYNYKF